MTSILSTTWTLFTGVMVLFLPGLAWLVLFWDPEQDAFERLGDILGISISATSIFALYVYLVGWQVSSITLLVLYCLLIPPAVWGIRRWWLDRSSRAQWGVHVAGYPGSGQVFSRSATSWRSAPLTWMPCLVLGLTFMAILAWRFYQIQDVVLPLWVDSVHHVQIVSLIGENGGLPKTFEPYMPVPFYYHYAFHALTAVFREFSGQSSQDAVLYLGQALNAAIALAVYRLGKALWADWRRAVLSALLVGFVTQMPAYYLTWGRYTLLTGMVLLPLAMGLVLDILNKGKKISRLLSLSVVTAGILLAHYYVGLLLAAFLIIVFILSVVRDIRARAFSGRTTWLPVLLATLLSLILAAPWLYRMWGFAQGGVKLVSIQPTLEAVDRLYFPQYFDYLWRLLGPTRNHVLLFAALPGLVLSLVRQRTRSFGLWTLALIIFSLPVGIYIAPFRPDHAVIILFLPTAMLISDFLLSAVDWRQTAKIAPLKTVLILIVIGALLTWGLWETRTVINSATILAGDADLQAINWIDRHLPQEARFLINVTHWQYGNYRGVDGGWWITPLSSRLAILPNGLYGMGEQAYVSHINQGADLVTQIEGCNEVFWQVVAAESLTHIYLTENKGTIQPDQFENCAGIELVYEQEGVYIFDIKAIINGRN